MTEAIFLEKLKELNSRRKLRKQKPLNKSDIAQVLYQFEDSSVASKAQRLSNVLSGKFELKYQQLRILRKIFQCSIDELFPISEDIDIIVEFNK